MTLYELFTKEEHEKIVRNMKSVRKKDVDKISEEISANFFISKTRNVLPSSKEMEFYFMLYLCEKEWKKENKCPMENKPH